MSDENRMSIRALALLERLEGCDREVIQEPELDDFLHRASRTGARDVYTDGFIIQALKMIAGGSTPVGPYDREDGPDIIEAAGLEDNKSLREWLHGSMERARFLKEAQDRHGPIFNGSELLYVARCMEEAETYDAVVAILSADETV